MWKSLIHAFFLLTVFIVNTNGFNEKSCLRRLVNGATCISRVSKSRPLDRFTCSAVQDIWDCDGAISDHGCPEMTARIHSYFTFENLRQMFLPRGLECPTLQQNVRAYSRRDLSCTNRELYKMNFAIATCGTMIRLVNEQSMLSNPCIAAERFETDCLTPNLRRCVSLNTQTYTSFYLSSMASFLESLASAAPNNRLFVHDCQEVNVLRNIYLEVQGSKDAEIGSISNFQDEPDQQYFSQNIRSILEEAIQEAEWPQQVLDVYSKRTLVHLIHIGLEKMEKGHQM